MPTSAFTVRVAPSAQSLRRHWVVCKRGPWWRSIVRAVVEHGHSEQHSAAAAQAAEWDSRYRERGGAMWSGRPNGRLVAEVAALTPGRVLEVGCGEGADAIWLAETRMGGHRGRRLRGRHRPGAAAAECGWGPRRVDLWGCTADAVRSCLVRSRCRCSTRHYRRPPTRPRCGGCSTRLGLVGYCSRSTTTSTTSTSST